MLRRRTVGLSSKAPRPAAPSTVGCHLRPPGALTVRSDPAEACKQTTVGSDLAARRLRHRTRLRRNLQLANHICQLGFGGMQCKPSLPPPPFPPCPPPFPSFSFLSFFFSSFFLFLPLSSPFFLFLPFSSFFLLFPRSPRSRKNIETGKFSLSGAFPSTQGYSPYKKLSARAKRNPTEDRA